MSAEKPLVIFAVPEANWVESLLWAHRRNGGRALSAASAGDLLAKAARCAPDAVVVTEDLVDDPEALLRQLRSRFPHAALFAILFEPLPSLERLCRELRVFPVLKPVDPGTLADLIRCTLSGAQPEAVEAARRAGLVMCVDDDLLFLKSLARFLARHGYRVASYDDPFEALQAIPEIAPDLAIVDVLMPGMNGFDLTEEIRESFGGKIPVLILTALASDADVVNGYRRGARQFITKPCEPRALLEAVESFVQGSGEEKKQL